MNFYRFKKLKFLLKNRRGGLVKIASLGPKLTETQYFLVVIPRLQIGYT
jgi:hypothetical protein